MAQAPAAEQRRLLDLQALDAKIKNLRSRARQAAQDPQISAAAEQVAAANIEVHNLRETVEVKERDLERAEKDVESVRERIARDTKRLEEGGLSRELVALQNELEALRRRQEKLEDDELVRMEQIETDKAELARVEGIVEAQQAKLSASQEEQASTVAHLDEQSRELSVQRAEMAESFDPALLALYERTLAKFGIGVARLVGAHSEGSGMDLSPVDLAQIKRESEDTIVFCPDSGVILIRSEEKEREDE